MDKSKKIRTKVILFAAIFVTFNFKSLTTFSATDTKIKKIDNSKFQDDNFPRPILSRTHILNSPITLPHMTLAYGTSLAMGLFDRFEISTNIFSDFVEVYNFQLKYNWFKSHQFASAISFGYKSYLTKSYNPGIVFSYAPIDELAFITGGNLMLATSSDYKTKTINAFFPGHTTNFEIAYMYDGRTNGKSIAIGSSYDFTYKLFGYGISHHWKSFQLGVHVVPKAKESDIMPIIVAGGAVRL